MFNEQIQQLILKTHRLVFPFPNDWMTVRGSKANQLIGTLLNTEKPCLITRFGSIETEAMMAYLYRNEKMSPLQRFYRFASWDIRYVGWEPPLKNKLQNNAGFFPPEEKYLNRFAELYLSILPDIDLIGSWIHAEILLRQRMQNTQRIPLADLEPYLHTNPWSKALENRKVLVIHPFSESISSQYAKRELLFDNPNVLPSFELKTLRAVQSSGGNRVPFSDWFTALDAMKSEIDKIEFDVAVIGAGAYGLPLAAHIKSIEKQAVHLGGATQMLFGIYGQRWVNDPLRRYFINEHWIRPLDSDKIENFKQIENGCYW